MRLRLLHAVAAGIVLALATGLLLIPSLTLVASIHAGVERASFKPPESATGDNKTTLAGYGGPTEAVFGLSPITALGFSLLAVALVLLSFLLVGRLGERTARTR